MSSKKIPTFEFHHNIKRNYEEYLDKFIKFIEKSKKNPEILMKSLRTNMVKNNKVIRRNT